MKNKWHDWYVISTQVHNKYLLNKLNLLNAIGLKGRGWELLEYQFNLSNIFMKIWRERWKINIENIELADKEGKKIIQKKHYKDCNTNK